MIQEPILMQCQEGAFNQDTFIQQEFIKLKDQFGLTKAIETGTCLGYTSEFLSKHFDEVRTVEVVDKYLNIAKENRLNACANVVTHLGSSSDMMPQLLAGMGDDTMIFLDAHWQNHCPLKEELKAISDAGIKPVIAIHDFKVPTHPELGFDMIGDQPFTYEWLKEDFDRIYGEDGYKHYYNNEATEVKRGIIYVTPINQ
jgi:hypothetical protein